MSLLGLFSSRYIHQVAVKQASDVMLTFGMAKMFNLPITIKNTGTNYLTVQQRIF